MLYYEEVPFLGASFFMRLTLLFGESEEHFVHQFAFYTEYIR